MTEQQLKELQQELAAFNTKLNAIDKITTPSLFNRYYNKAKTFFNIGIVRIYSICIPFLAFFALIAYFVTNPLTALITAGLTSLLGKFIGGFVLGGVLSLGLSCAAGIVAFLAIIAVIAIVGKVANAYESYHAKKQQQQLDARLDEAADIFKKIKTLFDALDSDNPLEVKTETLKQLEALIEQVKTVFQNFNAIPRAPIDTKFELTIKIKAVLGNNNFLPYTFLQKTLPEKLQAIKQQLEQALTPQTFDTSSTAAFRRLNTSSSSATSTSSSSSASSLASSDDEHSENDAALSSSSTALLTSSTKPAALLLFQPPAANDGDAALNALPPSESLSSLP